MAAGVLGDEFHNGADGLVGIGWSSGKSGDSDRGEVIDVIAHEGDFLERHANFSENSRRAASLLEQPCQTLVMFIFAAYRSTIGFRSPEMRAKMRPACAPRGQCP